MSQQSNPSSSSVAYYSTYRGPVFQLDGRFDHFARRCDEAHLQNGYYEFATCEDDRRAYELGMHKPEDILIAQDACDGTYNDIMIRWIPGKVDEMTNKSSVGTAAEHLETIYNERKLLCMPLSFRSQMPLYPSSKDQKLINYRLARYGVQKGALPESTLSLPVYHDVQTVESSSPSIPKKLSMKQPIDSITVLAPALSQVRSTSVAIPSRHATTALQAPSDDILASSSSLMVIEQTVRPLDRRVSTESKQAPLVAQQSIHNVLSLDIAYRRVAHLNKASCTSSTQSSDSAAALVPEESQDHDCADVADDLCAMHTNQMPSEAPIKEISVSSWANQSALELPDMQSAFPPCMDCGLTESHTSQCWINKVTLCLRPIDELSTSQLREIAESTAKFDPGPWTSHTSIPRQPPDDSKIQMKEMAEIVRNLNTFTECPDLHALDDQLILLSWGLMSSVNVEILQSDFHHQALP